MHLISGVSSRQKENLRNSKSYLRDMNFTFSIPRPLILCNYIDDLQVVSVCVYTNKKKNSLFELRVMFLPIGK